MHDFFAHRPLSVIAALVFNAIAFLTSLGGWPNVGVLMSVQREMRALGEPSGLGDFNHGLSLMAAFVALSTLIPILNMVALYRDSHLGLRAMMYGAGVVGLFSAANGVFPGGALVDAALIAWLAYELNGFNIIAWTEERLARARRERGPSGLTVQRAPSVVPVGESTCPVK